MIPANINLTIYQGTTFKKDFQWLIGTPSTPVDITNFKIRMQIRATIKDTNFIVELTTENGRIIISDAINGKFYLFLDDSITSGLTIKSGVYDIEIIDLSLHVERLIQGSIIVSPEVTRPLI